ncbi:MAG: proton-conducting transporter membrane subunit [Methylobacter sp.]|nr:proton-conducting transporter membrane subunit [Methylobacter sp.]
MDALVILIPLIPLIAAAIIGLGHLFGFLKGEASENITADIAGWAISMSFLLSLALLGADLLGKNTGIYSAGPWLSSDSLDIHLNFISTGINVRLAALFSMLLALIIRFSIDYMHREAGYHRFFFILSLFTSAMLLLVLSGNIIFTFIGWEFAGLCSYLLVGYAYDRPVAVTNASRIFITNRIGDAGFLLGAGLSYAWVGSVNWNALNVAIEQLSLGEATSLALCFSVAAFAKSAQLPFTPWLAKAMEGPTPSSAIFYGSVMVHAGVYLIILLKPIFEHAPLAMAVLAIVGLLTAVYSYVVGLTQTDVKSSLIFATSGQLGLMFLECGLGFWNFAAGHLCAHAVVRAYQFLTSPSLMHNVRDLPPATPPRGVPTWLYVASLQRFWLDPITDWALVKPFRGLAHDLSYFDDHIVDWLMGAPAPAINAISSLAQLEEKILGAKLDNDSDLFAQGSGLAGKLTESMAAILHWFEDRIVLRGIGKDAVNYGRGLGHIANMIEKSVLRPRYLVLFVFITLLVAF